jgi:hypothetical protein
MSASRLPKVIEAWEEPAHEEFIPRTAWSPFNAFTEVQKSAPPRPDGREPPALIALSDGVVPELVSLRGCRQWQPRFFMPHRREIA